MPTSAMTLFRRTVLILVSILVSSVGVPGAAGSVMQQLPPNPAANTVSAPCSGGPGSVFLTVHPPAADGTYRVDVTARRLVEGSRWKIAIGLDASEEGDQQFRRRAVNGEWSVTTQVAGPTDGDDALFQADAEGVGARQRCLLFNFASNPPFGLAGCNGQARFQGILARRLDDDTVRVLYIILDNQASARWHVELTARSVGAAQTVAFDDLTNKEALLRSRVDLHGVDNPRLRIVATRTDGRQCRIGLNPPNAATQQSSTPSDMRKLVRAVRGPH